MKKLILILICCLSIFAYVSLEQKLFAGDANIIILNKDVLTKLGYQELRIGLYKNTNIILMGNTYSDNNFAPIKLLTDYNFITCNAFIKCFAINKNGEEILCYDGSNHPIVITQTTLTFYLSFRENNNTLVSNCSFHQEF